MNAFTGSSNLIKKINLSVFKGLLRNFFLNTSLSLYFQPRRKTIFTFFGRNTKENKIFYQV